MKEKIVVFFRSRERCESLTKKIGCDAYHMLVNGMGEKLESWMGGESNIIIVIGALSMEMNVSTITRVIHVEMSYEMIIFSQKFERIRRKEKMKSIILLSMREDEYLKNCNPRMLI